MSQVLRRHARASSCSAASARASSGSTASRRRPASSRTRATSRPRGCSGATRCAARTRTRASARSTSRAALTMPGVHAVLTHDDVPGQKTYGLEFADQPVLAIDRVRYFGEPVAVVAAEHPEQARRAAERIVVEYEPLEPIADPERATESEPLHPDRPTAGHGYRDDPRPNVVRTMLIRHGDPEAAGDVTVSGVYELGIAGPGVPRAGVGARGAGRRGRRRHLRRDAVAARRPGAGRALPGPVPGPGPDPPRRRRRRVRRARGPLDADPLGAARAAHEPPGEDGLQPRGVVHGARSPPPGADLGRAPRDARRAGSSTCACGSCSTAARTPRARPP